MKSLHFLILISWVLSFMPVSAQEGEAYPYPPTLTDKGITYWCGYPINDVMQQAELVFEGRILNDSVFFFANSIVLTYHRVLVLKQFKGNFKSDTIAVATGGGEMLFPGCNSSQGSIPYAFQGDEAVFFVSNEEPRRYKVKNPDLFVDIYGEGCGFIKVCDKKDIVKEIYEPIEAATKTPRIVLRKNSCEK